MKMLTFILIIACVSGSAGQFTKWLKNTDLNNPYNWDRVTYVLTCGNDRMILPDDGSVVFMQLNTTIQELVLPRDGELVFSSYATLAFTNNPDHSAACLDSGTDITFNASHPADWFDPDNWCPMESEQGQCKSMAQLDTEKIPCQMDHVVFPTGSSYYVDLGAYMNITVNTLKVSGKAYSTLSFQDFLATENGQNIFPAPRPGPRSTVNIIRRSCKDDTGCGCGNDQGQIMTKVCQIQRARCRRPRCTRTIKPVGHCCDICGGMLNISYGVGFNLNTLKNGIQRNFLDGKDAYKNVNYIVSKRSDGKIQIVLSDDDGVQSSKATAEVMTDLNAGKSRKFTSEIMATSDFNSVNSYSCGGLRYGITRVTMASTATGGPSTGGGGGGSASAHTGTGDQKGSMGKGSVAGITIGVIIVAIIGVAVGYFVYQNKYRQTDESAGFSASVFSKFNRFNASQKRKPQVSVPPSVGFSWGSRDSGLSSISGATSQGFDNPIYGSVPMENMKQMDLEMTPGDFNVMSDNQPDKGFDNPLYDTDHQESLFRDPTEVENPEFPSVMTLGPSHLADTDA